MRYVFLFTPAYAHRTDLAGHAPGPADGQAVRARLSATGYDFRVVQLPDVDSAQGWMRRALGEQPLAPDDVVIVYVSAFAHLDDAGELCIELDQPPAHPEQAPLRMRVPVARLRSAMIQASIQTALVFLELVCRGVADDPPATDYVAAARRVFAPGISGYAMMCAIRAAGSGQRGGGPSSLTALWLAAMERPERRNAAGAVVLSKLIEGLRDDPDLYSDLSSLCLIAGRRDMTLYSVTSATHSRPPPVRLSAPPSVPPDLGLDTLMHEGRTLHAQGAWDEAADVYKRLLLLLGDERSARRAESYAQLGRIRVEQGRSREAIISYRKAASIEPQDSMIQRDLATLLRSEGEFLDAAQICKNLLETVGDDRKRIELLLAIADDYERAGKMSEVMLALESAWNLDARNVVVLERLEHAYESLKALDKLAELKVAVARQKPDPEQIARFLVLAGDFVWERLADAERALAIYEQALDTDPLTAHALDAALSIHKKLEDTDGCEAALLHQAERLRCVGAHSAEALVWREIAAVRRAWKHDSTGTVEALERCLECVPEDVDARVTLAELYVEAQQWERASEALMLAAFQAPGRVDTYRTLHEIALHQREPDRIYLTAAALAQLDEADVNQQLCFEQHTQPGLIRPVRSLDDAGWRRLSPLRQDFGIHEMLTEIAAVAIEYKLQNLRKQGRLPQLDPLSRQDPQLSTVTLTRTFVWASTVLDVPLPEIYVADDVPGGIAAVAADVPTAMVGRSVLSGRTLRELAFLVGRDLTYYRPDHYILVLYPTLAELTALVLGAIRVAHPAQPAPPDLVREVQLISRFLRTQLGDRAQASLRRLADQFDADGVRDNLASWARSVEVTATRAGLLVCGDVCTAASALAQDDRSVGDMTPIDRMNDLLPFSVSSLHAELRQYLGVHVT